MLPPTLAEARSLPTSTSYSSSSPLNGSVRSLYTSGTRRPTFPLSHHKQQVAGTFSRAWYQSLVACSHAASAATEVDSALLGVGEIVDVEDVEGIRILPGDGNQPIIQYLIKWKDGAASTWEPVENLSDNLLRDFEDKWWKCCRDGDEETMQKLLANSKNALPFCVDSNERSALHFAAALGKRECCQMLCEAGAEVDFADKDGYTPLHMAVGYSHVATVQALLEAGANPEIPDTQGRNVVQLVDSIREQMPRNPQLAGKCIALEEVSALLTGNLFEEVLPKGVLESRTTSSGGKEYLLQWLDGAEDSWVKGADVASDVIEDFEKGYEYAQAESLRKMKGRGDQRLYLVRWLDGRPDSWEFEDHVSPALVAAFERAREGTAESQQALLPEPLETQKRLSKRAQRRAKKLARQAATSDGDDSSAPRGAGDDESASGHGKRSTGVGPGFPALNGPVQNGSEGLKEGRSLDVPKEAAPV